MSAIRTALQRFTRSFKTSPVQKSGHHDPEGFPGANLPFSISNRHVLAVTFVAFFGSGFAVPFAILRYHLKK